MKNKGTHFLVQGAAIAAVYVVLTPVSYTHLTLPTIA